MKAPYDYGMWTMVVFNIGLFGIFVFSFLRPKLRREWRSMGVFAAFLVALFTEMYGFPLTIYLLTSYLGSRYPVVNPFSHDAGNLWAMLLGGSTWLSGLFMFVGGAFTFIALIILGRAWKQIHNAKSELVTSGLYGLVRHPQYSGMFLLILGFFIQWPTLITAVMAPVLVCIYYRLALREDKDTESRFGDSYTSYRQRVPMFFPRLGNGRQVVKVREVRHF